MKSLLRILSLLIFIFSGLYAQTQNSVASGLNHPNNKNAVYFFSGDKYYRYNWKEDKVDSGYPASTTGNWKGLPAKIDAALKHPSNNNVVYFFSGDKYYRYNWKADKVDNGYPAKIKGNWKGLPTKIDAAINHPTSNNIVYFFSGDKYYRYNWKADKVDSGYPASVPDNWKGLPKRIAHAQNDHGSDKDFKPKSDDVYVIMSVNSGKVLDVPFSSKKNGEKLIQWTRHNGPNQQFRFESAGNGYFIIVNVNSAKALEVSKNSMSRGVPIIQSTKTGKPSQQFKINKRSSTSDSYVFFNLKSGKAWDIFAYSKKNGGRLLQWDVNKSSNQQFKLIKLDNPVKPTPVLNTVYDKDGTPVLKFRYKEANFTLTTECSVDLKDPTSKKYVDIFFPACDMHDRNYQAPWRAAGYSGYEGKVIADEKFHRDMITICNDRYDNVFEKNYCKTVAGTWYEVVKTIPKVFEAFNEGQVNANKICDLNSIEKGGSITVFSDALYHTEVKVDYLLNGKRHKKSGKIAIGQNKSIALPIGATDINLKVKGIACGLKFNKHYNAPTIKNFKVWGSIFKTKWKEV